jgi:isohexenylglutaconyl-CoA hydratase
VTTSSEFPYKLIKFAVEGPRAFVTLNRPNMRNALGADMLDELLSVVDLLESSQSISVVMLRGAGGTFCAGGNLKGLVAQAESLPPGSGERDPIALNNRRLGTFLERFDRLPQTIIVAVEGAAFGGGVGLASIGDIAVAMADAQFAISETGLGLIPAQIAPFVAARIGVSQTRRLALTGARIDGWEAVRIGLVHQVCKDSQEFEETLQAVVAAAARCAPRANESIKRLLLASSTTPLTSLLDRAADAFALALRGPEGREGLAAFLKKRRPTWAER